MNIKKRDLIIGLLCFILITLFYISFTRGEKIESLTRSNKDLLDSIAKLNDQVDSKDLVINELEVRSESHNIEISDAFNQISSLEDQLNESAKREELLDEKANQYELRLTRLVEHLESLYGPNSDERTEIVDDVFYSNDVHLKPQMINYTSHYHLDGVAPHDYEYADDSVYIYYFYNQESLLSSLSKVEGIFKINEHSTIYNYIVNESILIIYIPYDKNQTELVKEQVGKLENAISLIEKALSEE